MTPGNRCSFHELIFPFYAEQSTRRRTQKLILAIEHRFNGGPLQRTECVVIEIHVQNIEGINRWLLILLGQAPICVRELKPYNLRSTYGLFERCRKLLEMQASVNALTRLNQLHQRLKADNYADRKIARIEANTAS